MSRRARFAFFSLLALSFSALSARADLPRTPPPQPAQYEVKVDAPAAKVGTATTAHVSLKPAVGFHVNKDYPTSLKLVAPEGVALAKAMMSKADGKVEEAGASFDVGYTASTPGKKIIAGTLKFAVCTASTCDPRTQAVAITVDVK